MEQNTPNIIIFKRKKHKDNLTNNIDLLPQKYMNIASLNITPGSEAYVPYSIQLPNQKIASLLNEGFAEPQSEGLKGPQPGTPQRVSKLRLQPGTATPKVGGSEGVQMNPTTNEFGTKFIPESFTRSKTKKNKKTLTTLDKSKLWNVFDTDKKQLVENTSSELECIYEQADSQDNIVFNCIKSRNATQPTHFKESSNTNLLKPNNRELDLCTLCNSVLIIMEDGFPTCTNTKCGIIYKNTLDYSPEWRFYGADDKNTNDPTRCGNPINPLLVESSYGCKILCTTKSSYEMKKIRKWTEWQSMPHKEKSLYEEFQFITIMAQNAGIPKIFIDDAMIIHKDISEQKMFRGLNRDGIKAASIYISCRLNSCPRTAHEISEIFKLDKTSATNGCSTAVNILNNIERDVEPSQQTNLQQTTPSSFIERYCSKLNVNAELTMLSKFVAQKIEHAGSIMDNTPHAIAAGIVFFISQNCNLNISKYDIKQICGVSEVTINKCFKKLENMRTTLIPNCILEKYK